MKVADEAPVAVAMVRETSPSAVEACARRCLPLQLFLYLFVTFPLGIVFTRRQYSSTAGCVAFSICFAPFQAAFAIGDLLFICLRCCVPLSEQSAFVPLHAPSELVGAAFISWAHGRGRPDSTPALLSFAWSYLGSTFSGDASCSSLAAAFLYNDVAAISTMLRLDPRLRPTTEKDTGRRKTDKTSIGAVGPAGGRVMETVLGGEFHVLLDGKEHKLQVPDRDFLISLADTDAAIRRLVEAQVAARQAAQERYQAKRAATLHVAAEGDGARFVTDEHLHAHFDVFGGIEELTLRPSPPRLHNKEIVHSFTATIRFAEPAAAARALLNGRDEGSAEGAPEHVLAKACSPADPASLASPKYERIVLTVKANR